MHSGHEVSRHGTAELHYGTVRENPKRNGVKELAKRDGKLGAEDKQESGQEIEQEQSIHTVRAYIRI